MGMTQKQIMGIVKVLGFRRYGGSEDSYKLNFQGQIQIYLYQFASLDDKPQGWRVSIYSPDSQEAIVVKKIEVAEDILSVIYEYATKTEGLRKKEIFKNMLYDMNEKVRDLEWEEKWLRIDLRGISRDIEIEAERLWWEIEGKHEASTGTIYLELSREKGGLKEWIVIRVSDHRQIYLSKGWLRLYSHSPYELSDEDVKELLGRGFGEIGDVL
jgi:hypothetical protein